MASAIELLNTKLNDFLIKNQNFEAYVSSFKQLSVGYSTEDLQTFDVGQSLELNNYRVGLLFNKYLQEAPKGEKSLILSKWLIAAKSQIPDDIKTEVIEFLTNCYVGGFLEEIKTLKTIPDFKPWIEVLIDLQTSGIEIPELKDCLAYHISLRIWDLVAEIEHKFTEDLLLPVFDTISIILKGNFDLDTSLNIFVSCISDFLLNSENIPKLYSSKTDPKTIVSRLKTLNFSKSQKILINELESVFGVEQVAEGFYEDFVKPLNIEPIKISVPELKLIETIHCVETEKVNFNIFKCDLGNGVNAKVKVYEAKEKVEDLVGVKKEIEALETLSAYANEENCFLKFFGSAWEGNKVYFVMEQHANTLIEVISCMKQGGQSMPDEYILLYAFHLLTSFVLIEKLNIPHKLISPYNVLVTPGWRLRLAIFPSFLLSFESAEQSQPHFIQSPQSYATPESPLLNSNSKADIFSLGLLLLQLYSFDPINPQDPTLPQLLQTISIPWLKTLLNHMLSPSQSPTFHSSLRLLPNPNILPKP